MSQQQNLMELSEDNIRTHYASALAMLDGFDHTPRIAKPKQHLTAERSPGIAPRRSQFRSTTPGLVTRSTARPEGVHIINRVGCARGITRPRTRQPLPSAKPNKGPMLKSGRYKPSAFGWKPSPSRAHWQKRICEGAASLPRCLQRCASIRNAGTGRLRDACLRWWRRCRVQACQPCIALGCALTAWARPI